MTPRPLRFVIAALLSLGLSASASATTVVGGSLEDLVERADEVIRGTVVDVSCEVRDGRIITLVVVDAEVLYRSGQTGEVELVVPGGRVGDLVTWVPGAESYARGEEVVVLASRRSDGRYMSMGLSMTKFTVEHRPGGNWAVRDLRGLNVVNVPSDTEFLAPDADLPTEIPLATFDELLSVVSPEAP